MRFKRAKATTKPQEIPETAPQTPKEPPSFKQPAQAEPEPERRFELKQVATQTSVYIQDNADGSELTVEQAIVKMLNQLDDLQVLTEEK